MKKSISSISLIILFSLIKYNRNGICSQHCNDFNYLLVCSSCENHYYLFFNLCIQCDDDCKTCEDSSDKCLSCYEGYYLYNSQCFKCNANCKTCKDSVNNCLSCNKGYYLNSGNKCNKCPNACETCNNENKCLSCVKGYFLFSDECFQCNMNCCNTKIDVCKCNSCFDGYYLSNYQCIKCDSNCKTCSNSANNCKSCHVGYYLKYQSCKECISPCNTCNDENLCKSCIDGYFLFSDECLKCNVNCKTSNDSCKCDSCEDGYYLKNYQCLNCTESNCKTCPNGYNKLITNKNKCIDDCKKDENYQYEYNNTCYVKCPNNTYILDESNDYKCFEEAPDGYYLDKEKEIYKKCYETCKNCDYGGNKTNHNCLECKNIYKFYNNSMNFNNCYEICEDFYYFDESNEYHCTKTCQGKYNKTIIEKKACIDDCKNEDTYLYEYNNICYKECQEGTITNKTNFKCNDIEIIETTVIEKNTYENKSKVDIDMEIEKFREMISNFNVSKDSQDIITKKNNIQYQMTTSDNQKNNTNKNMSTIDLGDCEDKLKEIYDIDSSLPLIIFKIDYFNPETLIPIIGYEIYHPITKEKLNLSYCEDILIKLNIPVNIDEDILFKYDPNSEFYNDNCFAYTTENGTDIILNDRKQEFVDNKLSLCENNCNYTGYSKDVKQSSCNCNVKNKMDTISEIIENSNNLTNNIDSKESGSSSSSSNIISIKCTKALFSKEGLKNNISSYILLIFIAHFLLSIILFIKCGYPLLARDINNILYGKRKEKKENSKMNLMTQGKQKKGKKNGWKRTVEKNSQNPPKKYKLNLVNNMNLSKIQNKKTIKFSSAIKLKDSRLNNRNNNLNKNNINNNVFHCVIRPSPFVRKCASFLSFFFHIFIGPTLKPGFKLIE